MASSSRIRQTVLRLIGLFSSTWARSARSEVDWRLSGSPVRWTISQAMETTTALSRAEHYPHLFGVDETRGKV